MIADSRFLALTKLGAFQLQSLTGAQRGMYIRGVTGKRLKWILPHAGIRQLSTPGTSKRQKGACPGLLDVG